MRNAFRVASTATELLRYNFPGDVIDIVLKHADSEPSPLQVQLTYHFTPGEPATACQHYKCPVANCKFECRVYHMPVYSNGTVIVYDLTELNDVLRDHIQLHYVNENVAIRCYSARGNFLK